jgi:hypothetical protein
VRAARAAPSENERYGEPGFAGYTLCNCFTTRLRIRSVRAPDCCPLSSLSIYYGYLTYYTIAAAATTAAAICSPPREKNNDKQLPPLLIFAHTGVHSRLAHHPVDAAAYLTYSLLVNTVILPSSVFTLARPDSSQNPLAAPPEQPREVRTWSKCLWPPAIRTHRRLITQHLHPAQAHDLPRQRSSSPSQNLCCPLAPFRYPPNTPEHKSKARVP